MFNSNNKTSQPPVIHISSAKPGIVSPAPLRSTIITVDRLETVAKRWETLAATPHPSALVPGFAPPQNSSSKGGVPVAIRECTEGRDYTRLEDPTRFDDSTRLQVTSRVKMLMAEPRCKTPPSCCEKPPSCCQTPSSYYKSLRARLFQPDPLDYILNPPTDGNSFSEAEAYAFTQASAWSVAPAELEGMTLSTPYDSYGDDVSSPVLDDLTFWDPLRKLENGELVG